MRGPPPLSLIRLYNLVYSNPLMPNEELAEALKVKPSTIRKYRERLSKNMSRVTSFCPQCFKPNVWQDPENGERVCKACGLVVDEQPVLDSSLPFDTTYAHTSNIAFGKSLGFTLNYRKTFMVLAKARKHDREKQEVPIRQIMTIANAADPPLVEAMLRYGSRLLKILNLDRDTDAHHVFSNEAGKMIREIAAFMQISKVNVRPHLAVRAVVYYLMLHMLKRNKRDLRRKDEFLTRFPLDERTVRFVSKFLELKMSLDSEAAASEK